MIWIILGLLAFAGLVALFIWGIGSSVSSIVETIDFIRSKKEYLDSLPEEERPAAKKKMITDGVCIAVCVVIIIGAGVFVATM